MSGRFVDPFAGALEAAWDEEEREAAWDETDDEADASNAVGALFPRQEDPLADLREPERRASNRRQKPYGTVDPDHELHRSVRDIFLGSP